MTLSPEAIEGWNQHMDSEVERLREEVRPFVVEETRRLVEATERANPDLPKHSHRFAWEALHPETAPADSSHV